MLIVVILAWFGLASRHCTVDVDLEFLELQGDEIECSYDDRVGSFDSLQCEDAEFEFIEGSRCGVLQSLDLEQEDGCCCVDAVRKREDDMAVAECSTIKIEEREDSRC